MGLIINVYRDSEKYDCTLGGISARYDRLCLINVPGPFEPNEEIGAALLVEGAIEGVARIIPADCDKWVMFGGNYGAISDSRFSEAVEKIVGHRFYGAVAIHDRTEKV